MSSTEETGRSSTGGRRLRVLVTGAKGMLGSDLCEALAEGHQVIARDVDDFNITDRVATLAAIGSLAPEAIVHAAAFTDVEACEERREHAFACNALGAMNVAVGAREAGAVLVYLSTDYVFDGAKAGPYIEIDRPNPINFYGLTKLYGERYVACLAPSHLIVRTSWLFGPRGRNFIDTIVAKARSVPEIDVVHDQTGCPTYTLDLARAIKDALDRGLEGTIHLTNSGETTWFELARHALAVAGVAARVRPVASGAYPTKAKRPRNCVLKSLVVECGGVGRLRPWEEAVRHHLSRKSSAGQHHAGC